MTIIDLIIKKACRIAELNLAEQDRMRASEMPDIETSKRFDRRMNRLIRRMDTAKHKSTRKVVRVSIAVAALIAVFVVTATGVDPWHERIRDFFVNTFSDGSIVEFEDDYSTSGTLYSEYTYIPAGYELVEHEKDQFYELLIFEDKDGNQLICSSRSNDESFSMLNSENIILEEIIINNLPAVYYSQDSFARVSWSNGEYNYSVYSAPNPLEKDELIKVSESRKNLY